VFSCDALDDSQGTSSAHPPLAMGKSHAQLSPGLVRTYQDSTARISGGRFRDGTIFEAYHDSNIDFVGSDFSFLFSPGTPVRRFLPLPMGPLRITSGLLLGRLESSLLFGPFQVE